MEKLYTDIDYHSFPPADLSLDIHWTYLPKAEYAELRKAEAAKREAEQISALPPDHKVILVPSDPDYSPTENDLWPVVNLEIQKVIKRYPHVTKEILEALKAKLAEYRGWRNPFPVDLHFEERKKCDSGKQTRRSR